MEGPGLRALARESAHRFLAGALALFGYFFLLLFLFSCIYVFSGNGNGIDNGISGGIVTAWKILRLCICLCPHCI